MSDRTLRLSYYNSKGAYHSRSVDITKMFIRHLRDDHGFTTRQITFRTGLSKHDIRVVLGEADNDE